MNNENTNQKTIVWQAPEFKHYEKNIGWYVTLVAISILVMGFFGIMESDWFAAVTIGIITVIVILFSRYQPELVTIQIDHKGLQINNLMFPYKQLKYFWIVNSEHHKTVNFDTLTYLNRTLIVQLADQDADEIRTFLLQYLPEHHETRETMAQRISHKLKF